MTTAVPIPVPMKASPQLTQPWPRVSRLGSVQRGQLARPTRCLFYGAEGVGKSSLAADAPSPIFFDIEGGSNRIDVDRYPFRDGSGGHVPQVYAEVLAGIDDLLSASHSYRTLVIDSVDALEPLLHKYVCAAEKKKSIEDFGYGKGYQVALDEWRHLMSRFDLLGDRGIGVVLIGHALVKSYKNPLGDDFDRYTLRVHDKAGGFIKEWCDVVGFLRFEEGASKIAGGRNERARGWATGRRIISLTRTAAWDAKTRISLPDEIELATEQPWAPFANAIAASTEGPDGISRQIDDELARLGDCFETEKGQRTAADVRKHLVNATPQVARRILQALRNSQPITSDTEIAQ